MGKVTENKKFKCSKCEKSYGNTSSFSRHKSLCGKALSFKCRNCQNKFTRPDSLRAHIKTCKGVKVVVCIQCGKDCVTPWRLKRHVMQAHLKQTMTFPCNNCGKIYKRECHLLSHVDKCQSTATVESDYDVFNSNDLPSFVKDVDATPYMRLNSTIDFQNQLSNVAYGEIALFIGPGELHVPSNYQINNIPNNNDINNTSSINDINDSSITSFDNNSSINNSDNSFEVDFCNDINNDTTINATSNIQLEIPKTPVKRFTSICNSSPSSALNEVSLVLTPKTRQRKYYRVKELEEHLIGLDLSKRDLVDVLKPT